jgi:hypothetical protein
LDLLNHILRADKIGARIQRFLLAFRFTENQNTGGFARTVRKHYRAPNLLIGVPGVYAELNMQFNRLVKFRLGCFYQ